MSKLHGITAAALATACLLAGCSDAADAGADADPDTDGMGMPPEQAAFMSACNEARGALYRVGRMSRGADPIHVSDLSHGAGYLRTLAENRRAAGDIVRHIDGWRDAVVARSQEITSLTPRFENGRVVEPDTTEMDRRMFERVKPEAVALTPWVQEVCGDLDDPFT